MQNEPTFYFVAHTKAPFLFHASRLMLLARLPLLAYTFRRYLFRRTELLRESDYAVFLQLPTVGLPRLGPKPIGFVTHAAQQRFPQSAELLCELFITGNATANPI